MANSEESNVADAVANLIEAAADKEESVRAAVCSSLKKLAKKCPSDILQCIVKYRKKNPKMPNAHLVSLFMLMEHVCKEHISLIDIDMVHQLVAFSVEELTKSNEYLPDVQLGASGVLVALGNKFCIEVMDGLVSKLQPGVLPHWAVLHTLADLAAANPFGFVPFVKATLGTLLPMLGAARSDAMRQAFAFALGRLSEAVLEYVAGLPSAPDPTVRAEAFAPEVGSAYDVLIASWLGSRDPRVLSPVLAALGPMLTLQGATRVREQAPRLISTLLVLYKRSNDSLSITTCLAAILQLVHETNPGILEPHLDVLLPVVFDQVCPTPDYEQQQTMKNHFEALRCFDHIARSHPGPLAESILQLLRNNNEKERTRAMVVTAHLVGSNEQLLGSHTSHVVAGLRTLSPVNGLKEKKALLKAIMALASRGHFVGTAGEHFVHFLVDSCCKTEDKTGNSELEEFARTCSSTLYLLASTVPAVEKTLWSALLQCLVDPKYSDAAGDIGRCLSHLAVHHALPGPHDLPSEDSYKSSLMGEEVASELSPHPTRVFARCLVYLSGPLVKKRGLPLLGFLRRYAASVHRLLPPLWEQLVPELVHFLENCKTIETSLESLDIWNSLMVNFVSRTLTEIDQCSWAEPLTTAIFQQVAHNLLICLDERASLYMYLSLAGSHCNDVEMIKRLLDVLLRTIRDHSDAENEAVAFSVGILSRRHFAIAFIHLEAMRLEDTGSRQTTARLLGWRAVGETSEKIRLTLCLAYGQVALEAPPEEVINAYEEDTFIWILLTLNSCKNSRGKILVLRALSNIAVGLHPNRCTARLTTSTRSKLLIGTLMQLKTRDAAVIVLSLELVKSLIQLPPYGTNGDCLDVLERSIKDVIEDLDTLQENNKNETDTYIDDPVVSVLSVLESLTESILSVSTTPAVLDSVFTQLETWFVCRSGEKRAAALSVLNGALQCYLANVKFVCEAPSRFGQVGFMLGRVIPRCTDPTMEVRSLAVASIHLILGIEAKYEGRLGIDNDLDDILSRVEYDLQTDDPAQLKKTSESLAQALCIALPPLHIVPLVDSLLDGLGDPTEYGLSGACVVLTSIFRIKGGELYQQIQSIIDTIVRFASARTAVSQTRSGGSRAVLALAKHHLKAVMNALLMQPLPFDLGTIACWCILGRDETISKDVLNQLLHLLEDFPLCEVNETRGPPVAVLTPLAAVAAMEVLFKERAMQDVGLRFPELFAVLFTTAASYSGVAAPVHMPNSTNNKWGVVPNRPAYTLNPSRVAIQSLEALFLWLKCDVAAQTLSESCIPEPPQSIEQFVEVIPPFTRDLGACALSNLPKVVLAMKKYFSSVHETERAAVAAFLARAVEDKLGGASLALDDICQTLLASLGDSSPLVRRLCLRGLSNMAEFPHKQRRHVEPAIFNALVRGLDEPCPLEALRGLTRLIPEFGDTSLLRSVSMTVALRIRPFFEREDPVVRAAALQLFGTLSETCFLSVDEQADNEALSEQVVGALVPLLLHLHDPDETVVIACKFALRCSAPLLGARKTCFMIQDHLIDEGRLAYEDFIPDLIRILGRELPEKVQQLISAAFSFTRGSNNIMRGDAVLLVGYLSSCLPPGSESTNDTCKKLVLLLKDNSSSVRAKAADALSYLYTS